MYAKVDTLKSVGYEPIGKPTNFIKTLKLSTLDRPPYKPNLQPRTLQNSSRFRRSSYRA